MILRVPLLLWALLLLEGNVIGQLLKVEDEFCARESPPRVTCPNPVEGAPPNPSSILEENVIRCYTSCIMSDELMYQGNSIYKSLNIHNDTVWPYFSISELSDTDERRIAVTNCEQFCRFTAISHHFICLTFCPTSANPEACELGCDLGRDLAMTYDADQVPATPVATPPISFDPTSNNPWVISLNLSAVEPDLTGATSAPSSGLNTSNMSSQPAIKAVTGIVVTFNVSGVIYSFSMRDPELIGESEKSLETFLNFFQCTDVSMSIKMVNPFGASEATTYRPTCIPGMYGLDIPPGNVWSPIVVIAPGSNSNPSMGSIILTWSEGLSDPNFNLDLMEIVYEYKKSGKNELDRLCLPSPPGVPGNVTVNPMAYKYTIRSGDHGNIKLLPEPNHCQYDITITLRWKSDTVPIPFLKSYTRVVPFPVDVIYEPPEVPQLQFNLLREPQSAGHYTFQDLYGRLVPAQNQFYESFDHVELTIGQIVNDILEDEIQEFFPLETFKAGSEMRVRVPQKFINITLIPERRYLVQAIPKRFNVSSLKRAFLQPPPTWTVKIEDLDILPPGGVAQLAITNCSIVNDVDLTMEISWQPPTFIFGELKGCTLTLNFEESSPRTHTVQNDELIFTGQYMISINESLPEIRMSCMNSYERTGPSVVGRSSNLTCLRVTVEPTVTSIPPTSVSTEVESTRMLQSTSDLLPTSSSAPVPSTTSPTSSGLSQAAIQYIIIGCAAGILLAMLLLVLAIIGYCCYKRKQLAKSHHFRSDWLETKTRSLLRRTKSFRTPDEWEIEPKYLLIEHQLGEGNFGDVFKASLSQELAQCTTAKKYQNDTIAYSKNDVCPIAVKLLKKSAPPEMRQSFHNEIAMMKKVASGKNIHVVKMVACVTIQEPLALVLEYVPYGNLLDYLRANRELSKHRRQLKKLIQQGKLEPPGKSKSTQQSLQPPLTPIEEMSMDSINSEDSSGYLRKSVLHGSEDKEKLKVYFSHLKPKTGQETAAQNDYSPVNGGLTLDIRDDFKSVSPYEEPVIEIHSSSESELGHNRPASYIQPSTAIVDVSADDASVTLDTQLEDHTSTNPSQATNPLYSEPTISEPYPDIGELESMNLMMFAYQISSGMEYLASLGIVHRDLACRNVLVDKNKILKISDFGLSRETETYVSSSQGRLPLRWMSPEAIIDRTFTEKSDVWAFGVTVWEICTLGGYPYATISNKAILQMILAGYRMDKPESCSSEIYEIMLKSWALETFDRPTFAELRGEFDELLMKSQPDQYIKVTEIDEDMVPYYKATSGNSGSSGDDDILLANKRFQGQTTVEISANMSKEAEKYLTPKRLLPSKDQRESSTSENVERELTQTISGASIVEEDITTDNLEEAETNNSRLLAITPQSSGSTIKDCSEEETSL